MTTHSPGLIRIVTSRYRDLQGLATVADAAFLLVFAAAAYLARAGWTGPAWLVTIVGGAYVWARFTRVRRWIDAYYVSRCGRVQWGLAFPFAFPLYTQGLVFGPTLLDIGVPPAVRVTFVLLLLAGLPARIVLRDWPYRAHWLLPSAAGILVAVMFASVTSRAEATAWLPPALLACGASLALAGLLDHGLLLKTLQPGPSDQAEQAPLQAP